MKRGNAFHILVHSPSSHSVAGLKPWSWNSFILVPCGWQMPEHLGHLLLLVHMCYHGTDSEVKQLGPELMLLWDSGVANSSLTLCITVPALGAVHVCCMPCLWNGRRGSVWKPGEKQCYFWNTDPLASFRINWLMLYVVAMKICEYI